MGLVGGAAAWPVATRAQQPDATRYLGVLVGLGENDADMITRLAGLRQGLAKRGWSEGRNIRIDYRYAPAGANAQGLAKELVASQPDLILGHTVTIVAALQRDPHNSNRLCQSCGPHRLRLYQQSGTPGRQYDGSDDL